MGSDNEYWRFTNDLGKKKKKKKKKGKYLHQGITQIMFKRKASPYLMVLGHGGSTDFKYGYRVKGKVVGAGSGR